MVAEPISWPSWRPWVPFTKRGRYRGIPSRCPPPAGVAVNRVGSMFTLFFTDGRVTDYESAKRSDTKRFAEFFRFMLDRGIYLAPSQFEAGFVSAAHTEEDIERTATAVREFFV